MSICESVITSFKGHANLLLFDGLKDDFRDEVTSTTFFSLHVTSLSETDNLDFKLTNS